MSFKPIEGHTSLFRATVLSAAQAATVQRFIEANGGDPVIRNKDLHTIAQTLLGMKFCPYFIGKNDALKIKNQPGMYDLSRVRASTKPEPVKKVKPAKKTKKVKNPDPAEPAVTEPEPAPAETPVTVEPATAPTPKPAKKTKKAGKAKPKKEAKAKKEAKTSTEEVTPEVPVEMVVGEDEPSL